MHYRKCGLVLILIWLLHLPIPAGAQTATTAFLSPPEIEDFPVIHANLEVYDGEGDFLHGLQPGDITIIEDNWEIPVKELEEFESGAQFVVALNLGPTFAIRDSHGVSRLQTIQGVFQAWAAAHAATVDDLSFLTNDGQEYIHLSTGAGWLDGFNSYDTDPRSAVPSLDVLVRAIEVASDPGPREEMGRAVLLLTPPPDSAAIASLQSIASLARQDGIRVHVWMVSSPAYFTSQGAIRLSEMSEQTGGQFFVYSGVESLPDIERYLKPLRYVYTLSYESKIRSSEPHQVYAQIDFDNQRIQSEPQAFDLQVSPPNPIFLSPPLEILRANTAALADTLTEQLDYIPGEQAIDILVEFPDGRPRPLVRSTLFVDGKIADENTSPPFDAFTWDLKDFASSGTHDLQVEVLDSFGLSGFSIAHNVKITIKQTPQSVISSLRQNAPIMAGAAVAIAAGLLLLALVVRGHIHPRTFGRRRKKSRSKGRGEQATDPTPPSPVPERTLTRQRLPTWLNRIAWPQRETPQSKPAAYLEHLSDPGRQTSKELIPISLGELTFGRDPKMATITFNDEALDDLHARMILTPEGKYKIFDEGSAAGTWVNYEPVSSEGVQLSHGDIIHIGRVGLCFKFGDKKQIPKPVVIPLEPET